MTEPAHYPHGPSGAHRWLICTDSPDAELPYPDETTDAADEGTAAHWMLEQCLKGGQDAAAWVANLATDKIIRAGEETGCLKDWPITGEMIEAVQTALDEVAKWAGFPKLKRGARLWPEERVHVGEHYRLISPVGGTADIIIYLMRSKTLVVLDFKYGLGHVVEIKDPTYIINPQIGLYLIAALCDLERLLGAKAEVKWVVGGIIQPRPYHKKGPVRTKKLSPMQLMDLEIAMIEAVNGPKVRVAGEHCFFCRAKPDCEAFHARRGELALADFDAEAPAEAPAVPAVPAVANPHHHVIRTAPEVPVLQTLGNVMTRPVKGLSLVELAQARQAIPHLDAWAKDVKEEVRTRLLHDLKVPGARLGMGRGSRDWGGTEKELKNAASATARALGEPDYVLYTPPALKSPAALEKQLGKAKFKETPLAGQVTYTAGGPVVVDEDSDTPDYVKDNGFTAEAEVVSPVESSLL